MTYSLIIFFILFSTFFSRAESGPGISVDLIRRPLEKKNYNAVVKNALKKESVALCPKPKTKKWIRDVCKQRIYHKKNNPLFCEPLKHKKRKDYLACLGITANASADRRICNRLLKGTNRSLSQKEYSLCMDYYQYYPPRVDIEALLDPDRFRSLPNQKKIHPALLRK